MPQAPPAASGPGRSGAGRGPVPWPGCPRALPPLPGCPVVARFGSARPSPPRSHANALLQTEAEMLEKWYRKMEPCGPSLPPPSETRDAPPELMQVRLWSRGSGCVAASAGCSGLAAALPCRAMTLRHSVAPLTSRSQWSSDRSAGKLPCLKCDEEHPPRALCTWASQ